MNIRNIKSDIYQSRISRKVCGKHGQLPKINGF